MSIEFLNLIVTSILTAVGIYLANNIERQFKLRIAEKQMGAYAAMWSKMTIASPSRIAKWAKENDPLSSNERKMLFQELVKWYYEDGNGMLLGSGTRTMFLKVKDNLVCDVDYFEPEIVRDELNNTSSKDERDIIRGSHSIRQLSLLRTKMRADLDIYGEPYLREIDEIDRAFLKACNLDPWVKPWIKATVNP